MATEGLSSSNPHRTPHDRRICPPFWPLAAPLPSCSSSSFPCPAANPHGSRSGGARTGHMSSTSNSNCSNSKQRPPRTIALPLRRAAPPVVMVVVLRSKRRARLGGGDSGGGWATGAGGCWACRPSTRRRRNEREDAMAGYMSVYFVRLDYNLMKEMKKLRSIWRVSVKFLLCGAFPLPKTSMAKYIINLRSRLALSVPDKAHKCVRTCAAKESSFLIKVISFQ